MTNNITEQQHNQLLTRVIFFQATNTSKWEKGVRVSYEGSIPNKSKLLHRDHIINMHGILQTDIWDIRECFSEGCIITNGAIL